MFLEEKGDERQNLLTGTFCFSLPNSVLCNWVWRSHLKRSLIQLWLLLLKMVKVAEAPRWFFLLWQREGESRGSSTKEGKDFGFCSCFEGLGLSCSEGKQRNIVHQGCYYPVMDFGCLNQTFPAFCIFFLIFNMLLHRFIHAKETFLTHFSVAHADADM